MVWPLSGGTNVQEAVVWLDLVRRLNQRRRAVGLGDYGDGRLVVGGAEWFRLGAMRDLVGAIEETAGYFVDDGLFVDNGVGELVRYTPGRLLEETGYGDWLVLTEPVVRSREWWNQLWYAVDALRWTTAGVEFGNGVGAFSRREREAGTLDGSWALWKAEDVATVTFYFYAVVALEQGPGVFLFDCDYGSVGGEDVPVVAGGTWTADLLVKGTTSIFGGVYGGLFGCAEGKWHAVVTGSTDLVSDVFNTPYVDGPAALGTNFGVRSPVYGGPDAVWLVKWVFE